MCTRSLESFLVTNSPVTRCLHFQMISSTTKLAFGAPDVPRSQPANELCRHPSKILIYTVHFFRNRGTSLSLHPKVFILGIWERKMIPLPRSHPEFCARRLAETEHKLMPKDTEYFHPTQCGQIIHPVERLIRSAIFNTFFWIRQQC